jgi:hypothetical protein
MSIRYGLQKMAVLDSANYDYAIIPLDASVGLLANNNDGKTSLVNALQFPLVPDRRRLSFGPKVAPWWWVASAWAWITTSATSRTPVRWTLRTSGPTTT